MTKYEFEEQARKAGTSPSLYDVIIDTKVRTRSGFSIKDGRVVGIDWLNEYKSEQEYNYPFGYQTKTFLKKMPYIIIEKNGEQYHVDIQTINAVLQKMPKPED